MGSRLHEWARRLDTQPPPPPMLEPSQNRAGEIVIPVDRWAPAGWLVSVLLLLWPVWGFLDARGTPPHIQAIFVVPFMIVAMIAMLRFGWLVQVPSPRVAFSADGVLDERVSRHLIPWSHVRGMHQRMLGSIVIDLRPDAEPPRLIAFGEGWIGSLLSRSRGRPRIVVSIHNLKGAELLDLAFNTWSDARRRGAHTTAVIPPST